MRILNRTFLLLTVTATLFLMGQARPLSPGLHMVPVNIQELVVSGEKAGRLRPFPLVQHLGKRPLVLFYWVADNEKPVLRAEEVLMELLAIHAMSPEKFSLLTVVPLGMGGITLDRIHARVKALGIDVPVLVDERFELARMLRVQTVPNINIVDANGILRLAGGISLRQPIAPHSSVTIADYLRDGLAGKGFVTIDQLPPYYPAFELVGKTIFDFSLEDLVSKKRFSLGEKLEPKKLTLLVFWAVTCPHCQKAMPKVNAYYAEHRDRLNLLSIVKNRDEEGRRKTVHFARAHNFRFPVLEDTEQVWENYRVISTPTFFVITPDGRIESAFIDTRKGIAAILDPKIEQLLQ